MGSSRLAAGVLLMSAGWAWGQVELPPGRVRVEGLVSVTPSGLAGEAILQVDPKALDQLWKAGGAHVVNFPLPDQGSVDLELGMFELLTPDARFFENGPGGLVELARPRLKFFRGMVAHEPDSLAVMTLFDGRIAGMIRIGDETWSFGPRSYAPDREGSWDLRIHNARLEEARGDCAGEWIPDLPREAVPTREELGLPPAPAIDNSTLLLGKIACEGTVEWSTKHGGAAGANTYTLNLMAQISAVYESEVRVQLQVPYTLMNTAESDGYSGSSNSTTTILPEMRTKWNASPTLRAVFRSAAHLFSTYPSGGSGRAYLDVLCDNVPVNTSSYDYGVSLIEGNSGSWEVRLVAHEIGHNFSSPHTHCYVPEIDQCYNAEAGCYSGTVVQTTGTIMSYCNTRVALFSAREEDEKVRPGAEAAFPACVEVAGMPGDVRQQDGSQLTITNANICGSSTLSNDDGSGNSSFGYSGATQAAWVKRFTPACYPYKLTRVDTLINNASVAVGRAIRVLVYTDPAGGANPTTSTLVHSQDVTVQAVSGTVWNQFTLTTPVILNSGVFYLGFYDLDTDAATTYIMYPDSSRNGDSWYQANSTGPSGYTTLYPTGTWMIRGQGGGVGAGSLNLNWGVPCNNAAVPDQDYAVYQGNIGAWTTYTNLTCSTARAETFLVESPPGGVFWLVVPRNSSNEGSYGLATSGQRPVASSPCLPQAIGACP